MFVSKSVYIYIRIWQNYLFIQVWNESDNSTNQRFYESAEGPPSVVKKSKFAISSRWLKMEAYVIRMT